MTVKELKKKLKGQYTDIQPVNDKHRDAIPFTQLGKDLNELTGKAFDKVFNEKEVVKWKLKEPKKVACWNANEFMSKKGGHYETQRWLVIYFK